MDTSPSLLQHSAFDTRRKSGVAHISSCLKLFVPPIRSELVQSLFPRASARLLNCKVFCFGYRMVRREMDGMLVRRFEIDAVLGAVDLS